MTPEDVDKLAKELSEDPAIRKLFEEAFLNNMSEQERSDFNLQLEKLYKECEEFLKQLE